MDNTPLTDSLLNLFHEKGNSHFVEKDTYLFQEGDPNKGLYLVLSGKVKLSKLDNDGTELTLRHVTKNNLFGELSLLNSETTYVLNAKMIDVGEVIILTKNDLIEEIESNGMIALELIQLMNERVRRDQTRFRDLVMYGKKGALYSTLIRLTNSYGRSKENGFFIDNLMTDQKLADFCGTSRESINRLMSELRKKQIISTNKGYITIHNLDFLKEAINCGDCPITLCSVH